MKNKYNKEPEKLKLRGIQSTIMITLSVITFSLLLVLGIVMYLRFSASARQEMISSTQKLIEQTGESLEDYLVSMRRISDSVYYNVIKESDFSSQNKDIQRGMNLLYEANRDNLRSIAVYNNFGSLVAAEPVALQKEDPDITQQGWYQQAMDEMENMHFSTPHIQNLFDDAAFRYYWVISLSRVVELTNQGASQSGVLLVDMDYSSIARMMKQINSSKNGQYFYLCDGNGKIIYHTRQIQISNGIAAENSEQAAAYKDGVYDEVFGNERRKVIVNTISYTGWKLVGVIPYSAFTYGMFNIRYFIVIFLLLMAMMLVFVNRVVSVKISRPILRLNDSILEYEAGETPEIYIGGSKEIRYLGLSVQNSYEQIDKLMKEIVLEQNERRKSELDALQSQINPHFLYNALDSIIWMVEGGQNDDAVFMISELAKFFRISLSKGRTVITIKDELQHAKSYMNIQKIRYKNAFSVVFEIDPAVYNCCTVKLILQPILENAINYGMVDMDGCGEIRVAGKQENGKIILSVIDNGMGMPEEEARMLLTDNNRVPKHGSGVGIINVNKRIQVLFGKEYGLTVKSELDEGTEVSICIPAVPYTEESRNVLEKGYIFSREELADKNIWGIKHEES